MDFVITFLSATVYQTLASIPVLNILAKVRSNHPQRGHEIKVGKKNLDLKKHFEQYLVWLGNDTIYAHVM